MAGTIVTYIPLYLVLVPMLTGIALYFVATNSMVLHKAGALFASLFSLAGVIFLLPMVLEGDLRCALIEFMQFGLYFNVDMISWVFAAIITMVWFLATLFSFAYMEQEQNLCRYYSFLIFTLGSILGVVFAGDFFSLFIFFEIMTFSSFVLVIHKQTREALRAGSLYLYMAILGGLSLLFAILLLYGSVEHLDMVPALENLGNQRTAILILFMIGFGIKAGLIPLHIWLPLAHPVAPTPASALLSGIMIKAGAYGMLRVFLVLFRPEEAGSAADWTYIFNSGYILMWIGIVTMLAGALMALLQSNTKRILAYSSISQMGYIAVGLGVAVFMGFDGAMGFTGSIYHIVNHAIFKAGLFAMIGVIYMYTHELDLARLGGMARKMPLVAAAFIIAALGIAGIPGFNGFASKTLIHDALLYAHQDFDIYGIFVAERLFVITSALTICYFLKLFQGVFLGPVPKEIDREYRISISVNFVISVFAGLVLIIGVYPNLLMERLLLPAARNLGFSDAGVDYLVGFQFFEWQPLEAVLVVVLLALFIYLPAVSRGWFEWNPPPWLSIQKLIIQPLPQVILSFFLRETNINDMALGQFYEHAEENRTQSTYYLSDFEQQPDYACDEAGQSAYFMTGKGKAREQRLKEQNRSIAWWDQDQWSIRNLNFDNLLLVVVLGVILFIVFFYGGQ